MVCSYAAAAAFRVKLLYELAITRILSHNQTQKLDRVGKPRGF